MTTAEPSTIQIFPLPRWLRSACSRGPRSSPALLPAALLPAALLYPVLKVALFEALAVRWPAIVATSLLFAAMHIPSHLGSGDLWVALAGMIAFQGFFGLFTGYLWSRYRRFWAQVVVHGAVNALVLLPLFLDI